MNKMTFLILSAAAIVLYAAGPAIGGTTGSIVFYISIAAAAIAWIGGLIKMIQLKRWGWFVAVLLLAPLSTLLYGIYGPTTANS